MSQSKLFLAAGLAAAAVSGYALWRLLQQRHHLAEEEAATAVFVTREDTKADSSCGISESPETTETWETSDDEEAFPRRARSRRSAMRRLKIKGILRDKAKEQRTLRYLQQHGYDPSDDFAGGNEELATAAAAVEYFQEQIEGLLERGYATTSPEVQRWVREYEEALSVLQGGH